MCYRYVIVSLILLLPLSGNPAAKQVHGEDPGPPPNPASPQRKSGLFEGTESGDFAA